MALRVDLTNHLNWNRLGTWNLQAEKRESGAFVPLLPVSAIAPSPLILAGGFNLESPPHWQHAAWCQPSVSVDPGSTAQGIGLAVLPSHRVTLNRYALILCPQFENVNQYVYTFYPARWIPTMTLEAWWYDGEVVDVAAANINFIKEQLFPPQP